MEIISTDIGMQVGNYTYYRYYSLCKYQTRLQMGFCSGIPDINVLSKCLGRKLIKCPNKQYQIGLTENIVLSLRKLVRDKTVQSKESFISNLRKIRSVASGHKSVMHTRESAGCSVSGERGSGAKGRVRGCARAGLSRTCGSTRIRQHFIWISANRLPRMQYVAR